LAESLAGERLPADVRDVAPTLLWALHMGILLYFVHDASPEQRPAVDLAITLRRIVTSPLLRPRRRRAIDGLADAGLLPSAGRTSEAWDQP